MNGREENEKRARRVGGRQRTRGSSERQMRKNVRKAGGC